MRRAVTLSLLSMAMVLGAGTDRTLTAQDFRVESQVFVGKATSPASENLTLYQGGLAYDFQLNAESPDEVLEVVIYDSRNKQLILLDTRRKLRTDVPDYELIKLVESLKSTADDNQDVDFLVNPQLESNYDVKTNWISVANDDIAYRATGKAPEQLAAMPVFYEAMDQYTRLSASDPKRLPPFARLALNREIRRYGLFPTEIEVNLRAGAITRNEFSARSTHTVMWQLSKRDLQRIEKAKSQWMSFEKVGIAKYRGLDARQAALDE